MQHPELQVYPVVVYVFLLCKDSFMCMLCVR